MTLKTAVAKGAAQRKSSSAGAGDELVFAPIADAFRNDASVTLGRMFGSVGLKVNGKVFAMVVKGDLVVKLSKERVDALIASGRGRSFDPGNGRLMKEWVVIKSMTPTDWLALVQEARRFVVGE